MCDFSYEIDIRGFHCSVSHWKRIFEATCVSKGELLDSQICSWTRFVLFWFWISFKITCDSCYSVKKLNTYIFWKFNGIDLQILTARYNVYPFLLQMLERVWEFSSNFYLLHVLCIRYDRYVTEIKVLCLA